VGTSLGHPALAGFAWTAALLHLWNHAAAKSLLFLGFGAVAQGAGTRRLDALGGVMRRWRVTGSFIILGAAAIASLPGLNVFASEWLLLRGLFAGALVLTGAAQVALLAAVSALAFAGAVALACFAGLVGLGLLGTSRSCWPDGGSSPRAQPFANRRPPSGSSRRGDADIRAPPRRCSTPRPRSVVH
jgi:formate hydrogenlyase subunit 3/multisubunit Na+/H+ antiporter MnhD subunit